MCLVVTKVQLVLSTSVHNEGRTSVGMETTGFDLHLIIVKINRQIVFRHVCLEVSSCGILTS